MSQTELPKAYEPHETEKRWYQHWLDNGVFNAEVNEGVQPFCIVIPPPNVTAPLHMGHALDNAIQDLLIRWHRMSGDETLWMPGTDHAGIATQNVVEKMLRDEGRTRFDLGREKFVERTWEVKERHHGIITSQLQRLGSSCDWRRERFTMDEGLSRAVREAFVSLYEEGLIYRGSRMISWCPRCETVLSDVEVTHEDHQGKLWHIRYPYPDRPDEGIVVATTRPETMLGDTGVAVNPGDARYEAVVGKTVILPLMEREIPIVADDFADPEFGSGAVKVTPAHDPNDLEIALRHDLPHVVVIGEDGNMTAEAKQYAGQERYECRRKVIEDLESQGLMVDIEDYEHSVGQCQRCDTVIEPRVSVQWFVKMEPLAQEAIAAVRDGRVRFVPERWSKLYLDWMENIRDWCISRQLWWGHQIPVWHCQECRHENVAREDPTECAKCGSGKLERDPDVLDTWFSSGLWPFSTMGWPDETPELAYFYPTSVLVTAYDIITFWVARMITMGLKFRDERPFADVFIHGLVRDEKGRKMSKSLGNVIDPLELMDRFGTDALRFALTSLVTHGQDITLTEDKLVGARNFCNKLWNAARLVLMNLDDAVGQACSLPEPADSVGQASSLPSEGLDLADRWILSRRAQVVAHAHELVAGYHLGSYAQMLYEFVWSEFCDWYLEIAKIALYGDDERRKATVQAILRSVLGDILKLLHPVMPFITEEIWQALTPGSAAIAREPLPLAEAYGADRDPAAEADFGALMQATQLLRQGRAALELPPGQAIPRALWRAEEPAVAAALTEREQYIRSLARIERFESAEGDLATPEHWFGVESGVEVAIPLAGTIDVAAELERSRKRLAKAEKGRDVSAQKLASEGFVNKAKPEVVERERARLAEAEAEVEKLQARVEMLEQASG